MSTQSFNEQMGKVWIFAGEASGDLYGAELAKELLGLRPGLKIQGMGGPRMAEAGMEILVDSSELGVVGLIEVLRHLRTFNRIFKDLVQRAERERPDVVVLIDYPGFNLRFARQMHDRGIKVVYYISPQVWAWHKRRKPMIAQNVDHMMVIFPFEEHIYDDYGLPTSFIGHPLIDILKMDQQPERDLNLVVLLPGSRISEVDRLFVPILKTAYGLSENHPDLHFVVPAPRERIADRLREILAATPAPAGIAPEIRVVVHETEHWLSRGIAGLAASGTVTVQCAIQGLPLVVVYRINPLTAMIMRHLIDLEYFVMVNLITKRQIFEEYLQDAVQPDLLIPAMEKILPGGERREEVLAGMDECVELLGGERNASRVAAQTVLNEFSNSTDRSG